VSARWPGCSVARRPRTCSKDESVHSASIPARTASSIAPRINGGGGPAQPSQSLQYAWAPFCRAIWDRCRTRKQE
jgi:hypothetical protein